MHRSRHRRWWRHGARRRARGAPPKILSYVPRLRSADRKSLLLGTALASTLLISAVLTPTPASAVACIQPPLPNPINTNTVGDNQPIICVNTEPRTNPAGNAINLTTDGTGSYVDLSNSGVLSATNNNNSFMSASLPIPEAPTVRSPSRMLPPLPRPTPVPVMPWPFEPRHYRGDSPITITNSGELHAYSPGAGATGIYAFYCRAPGPWQQSHQHREQRQYHGERVRGCGY